MEVPRYWRLQTQRYRLEGSICPACGQVAFPPRLVCPLCSAQPERTASCELAVLPASIRAAEPVSIKG